jgi:hypothetical protein
VKAVNSLLIAHGAGLVTCLTLLKDYDANPRLKGIGWFITLFVTGFGWAMFAYAGLILHRERGSFSTTSRGLKEENGRSQHGSQSCPPFGYCL